MTDFVAYPSRWRISLLICAGAGFVVAGLWILGVFGDPPSSRRYPAPLMVAFGWFSVIFFGFCVILAIRKLFDKGEQLRVGLAGIRWTSWSPDTIPWSEVRDVTTWASKHQKFIVLHLRDRSRFPAKGLLASAAGANRMMTGGDIAITLTGTDQNFTEALSAIERFRARG